jgi:hypothetical protein
MSFLTVANISDRLPIGFNDGIVTDILAQIEAELLSLGLSFTGFVTETRKIYADKHGQAIFDIQPFQSLSSLKIKQYNSNSETVLTENQDYTLVEHTFVTGLYNRVELVPYSRCHSVKHPQYLEMIGSWGFMSTVPADLKGVIVRYINSQLAYASNGYSTVTRAKTGDSDVTFSNTDQEFVNSITEYKPLISILNKYLI